MERLSTIVIQKLLDAFFLGLDAVDTVRRRVDRVLGRPEEDPFQVVWPDEEVDAAPGGNGEAALESEPVAADPEPVAMKSEPGPASAVKPKAKPKAKPTTKPKVKAAPKAKAAARGPEKRPKVAIEIEDLADKVKAGSLSARPLAEEDEAASKRMLARVVHVLGVAEAADLGGLTSTEVAHVLTFGCNIVTFGTNISRAIRQGTHGLVDEQSAPGKDPKRYALTDAGRAEFKKLYG